MSSLRSISAKGWLQLAQWTVFGTLGCVAVAIAINVAMFRSFGDAALMRSIQSATLIPVVLAAPLFFYLTLKLRELAVANHKLNEVASIDSLTSCLNRGAFSAVVDRFLSDAQRKGALLVIDADHFKSINDRFGHDQGDEALRIISTSIRTSIRRGDVVGRLGGEEFGVYLPGASSEAAQDVAERIRKVVAATVFVPDGKPCKLTVSVGGAVNDRQMDFTGLFRQADKRLYEAKQTGRNRVAIAGLPVTPSPLLQAG